MRMKRTTREHVDLSTCHLIPFSTVNISAESGQPLNPYRPERSKIGVEHAAVLTAVEYDSVGDKLDGNGEGAIQSYTNTSYNYGHPEVSQPPKDTSSCQTKHLLRASTNAMGHQPRRPCRREVQTEVGQANMPVGVDTAVGPPHLTPRHTETRHALTRRYSHHEVSYCSSAAWPWCL